MSEQHNQSVMTPSRPYLLRAFYEWIVDNGCTPYLVVDAEFPQVKVPLQYVEAGKIVLNVAEIAVKNLFIDNEAISFSARFSGRALEVYVPIAAAVAIYAKENGRGMVFGEDEDETADGNEVTNAPPKQAMGLRAVTETDLQQPSSEDIEPPPSSSGSNSGKGGKPTLHVVK